MSCNVSLPKSLTDQVKAPVEKILSIFDADLGHFYKEKWYNFVSIRL